MVDNNEQLNTPVILFDDSCRLCHGAVRFVVKRDPERIFSLCPLNSDKANALMSRHCDPTDVPDSLVLVTSDGLYFTGDAAIRIARELKAPWPFVGGVAGLFPKSVWNGLYRVIARNRYRWFGKREPETLCEPEIRARIEGDIVRHKKDAYLDMDGD